MMIEDEKREGVDNGQDGLQVVAQQKAEQDYAINVFKGSGEMSEVFDKIKDETQKEKAAQAQKEKTQADLLAKVSADIPNAKEGEKLIDQDAAAMYAFSSMAAANAGAS